MYLEKQYYIGVINNIGEALLHKQKSIRNMLLDTRIVNLVKCKNGLRNINGSVKCNIYFAT